MTSDELDRLEALANAATAGPWYQVYEGSSDWTVYGPDDDVKSVASLHRYHAPSCPDAPFIAAARDAVPALTKAVRERDAEIARLRALVEAAYEEGEANGIADSHGMAHEGWSVSYARQALEAVQ